jgi:SAM-dependent methyltransferase
LHAAAFDELAADYDAHFSLTPLGSVLRQLVWSRLDRVFDGAQHVLDLGCGTAEDALHLASRGVRVLAVDASASMVRVAEQKARHRGLAGHIEFHCLPMERLGELLGSVKFDGVLSNFGALNCVPDLRELTGLIAARLQPSARLLWVLMGRYVPWEWGWYLLRGDPARAWRRLPGSVGWRGLTIGYPTPRELVLLLQPVFRVDAVSPLGFALPPSFAGDWLTRSPRILSLLTRAERLAQKWPRLASCADHFMVEATRLPVAPSRARRTTNA